MTNIKKEKKHERKIYNLIITEEDGIRIINENKTLEEIYDFLDEFAYRTDIISGSITNIYQILHKIEKAVNPEEQDNDNIGNIKF